MPLSEVCTYQVACAHRHVTAAEAAQLMRQFHVGTLVVADGANGDVVPVGLVTDRDIAVGVVPAGLDPNITVVGDVMSPVLVTARLDDGIYRNSASYERSGNTPAARRRRGR